MRLSCAMVMPCRINVNAAVGFDLDACDASCLACHRRLESGDNSYDMVARLRLLECSVSIHFPTEIVMRGCAD